jgi:hypothetical protein
MARIPVGLSRLSSRIPIGLARGGGGGGHGGHEHGGGGWGARFHQGRAYWGHDGVWACPLGWYWNDAEYRCVPVPGPGFLP